MSAPFRLRLATAQDHASIYSDWLRSARQARAYQGISSTVYFFWMHVLIEQLLEDPHTCTWLVACAADDPTKIYGWLCGQRATTTAAGDQAIVHYVYTKRLYRRVGVATALLKSFVGTAPALVTTSRSESGDALLGRRVHVFNPFLLWGHLPDEVPKHSPRHPVSRSRRDIAAGGYAPAETGGDAGGSS